MKVIDPGNTNTAKAKKKNFLGKCNISAKWGLHKSSKKCEDKCLNDLKVKNKNKNKTTTIS